MTRKTTLSGIIFQKSFNYLFYLLIFIGFVLPNNSNYYVNIANVSFQFREITFLLIPFINFFCYSKEPALNRSKLFRLLWVLFVSTILITEVIKTFFYHDPIFYALNTIRIALPFISTTFLLCVGIRASIKHTWYVLNFAVLISAVITVLSPIFNFSFLYDSSVYDNVLEVIQGRLINDNASFGILSICILSMNEKTWLNTPFLKLVAILSIIILILAFSRTYLALMVLALLYCNYKNLFTVKGIRKISVYIFFFLLVIFVTYNSFELIKQQLDYRVLSILNKEITLGESVYEDVREVILIGVVDKISNGFWLFGLPYSIPIFFWERSYGFEGMANTDTTLVNVLLRYGILPLIFFVLILWRMKNLSRNKFFYNYLITFYGLASLNMDALMIHNSIFFFGIAILLPFEYLNNNHSYQ